MKFLTLLFVSGVVTCSATSSNVTATHKRGIVKRHLWWNADKDIVSSRLGNLRIDYLLPHSGSVAVTDPEANYMAFTLYLRNGSWIVPNSGVFHFIDGVTATKLASYKCSTTPHAGAYYHFYGICPSNDSKIVASGWCWQGSNGLVFNSSTFNSFGVVKHLDGDYYLNGDRTVHSIEEALLTSCYNAWKDSGFPVDGWRYSTSSNPLSDTFTNQSGGAGRVNVNKSCDCQTPYRSETNKGLVSDSVVTAYVYVDHSESIAIIVILYLTLILIIVLRFWKYNFSSKYVK